MCDSRIQLSKQSVTPTANTHVDLFTKSSKSNIEDQDRAEEAVRIITR